MSVNIDFAGRTMPPAGPFPVDADHIARFGAAGGATDPIHTDAGIDFSRVVHGEQAFNHHRPIVAGDEITGTTTVTSIREAGGHAMITVTTELTDADNERVCTGVSTIVVRGGE